jgi:hypothetical protein
VSTYSRHTLAIVLLALSGSPSLLHAQNPGMQVYLDIQNRERDLDYSGDVRRTRLREVRINWSEAITPWLLGGVTVGQFELSQTSNPITVGQSVSGDSLGLRLDARILRGDGLEVNLYGEYHYMNATSSQTDQDIEWTSNDRRYGVKANFHISHQIILNAGIQYNQSDGEEQASGTINQVIEFDNPQSRTHSAGLWILLDQRGQIGIEVYAGDFEGSRISFLRNF